MSDSIEIVRRALEQSPENALLRRHLADLLAAAGVGLDGISVVVPHQASRHALQYLRRLLGVERGRMIDLFAGQANQVAASLPSALDAAIRSGQLRRGETALLIGSGAGLGLGGVILRY
jgi:3-oxoacyl-[acyl-carrier-protein] synthase-3